MADATIAALGLHAALSVSVSVSVSFSFSFSFSFSVSLFGLVCCLPIEMLG